MSIKNVIDRIREFLQEENSVSLIDVKTQDGTILSYDGELTVGTEIFVLDETGRTPAPDGEYILEDGTKLSVMAGKIEEIEAPEMTPEVPEGEMPAEMPAEVPVEPMMEEVKKFNVSELTVNDLAEYPWDKCIADQKAAGYSEEVANKICGAIRSQNMKEELTAKIDDLKQENTEIKSILTQLAENLSTQSFKEEVKMSMQTEEPKKEVVDIKNKQKNHDLNNILKNMYK